MRFHFKITLAAGLVLAMSSSCGVQIDGLDPWYWAAPASYQPKVYHQCYQSRRAGQPDLAHGLAESILLAGLLVALATRPYDIVENNDEKECLKQAGYYGATPTPTSMPTPTPKT